MMGLCFSEKGRAKTFFFPVDKSRESEYNLTGVNYAAKSAEWSFLWGRNRSPSENRILFF